MKDQASTSIAVRATRNDKVSGLLATGGIAACAKSGTATFPRKRHCKDGHSFISGLEYRVCTKCGYDEKL